MGGPCGLILANSGEFMSRFFVRSRKMLNFDKLNLTGMKYDIRDILEYIVVLVNEFAKRFGLTDREAYNYIRHHKGVTFIEKNFGIMHTLDFADAVDSVATYCRRYGGAL